MTFVERYGPWALVTGAARGLGAEFARQLAQRGLKVALLDVEGDEVAAQADRITADLGVETLPLVVDLGSADVGSTVESALGGRVVGLLVNNAATGPVGRLVDRSADEMARSVLVNCRAPLVLTRTLVPAMASRGHGGVVFLSSGAALQGAALLANYAATKAYNLILAESLWDELRVDGIDVLAVAPGAVDTPGFRSVPVAPKELAGLGVTGPDVVVRAALNRLGKQATVFPGWRNRFGAFLLGRLMGRTRAAAYFGQIARRLYPHLDGD